MTDLRREVERLANSGLRDLDVLHHRSVARLAPVTGHRSHARWNDVPVPQLYDSVVVYAFWTV